MNAGEGRPRPLVIVNSGAYAHAELSAEFGTLPPAFLPVGNGRLYELQAKMFVGLQADLHLTLPESFELPDWDARRLGELGFTVLRTPDDLTLGEALLYALGRTSFQDRPLRILHGDTLLDGCDLLTDDVVAVAEGGDGYRWAQVALGAEGAVHSVSRPDWTRGAVLGPRLCGYFAFASAARFAERLALARGDIYDALNAQAAESALRAVEPERWLDFGHVQTYFRSRRIVTTARAFNALEIGEAHVRKRSTAKPEKLQAEARWLAEAPASLKPFCARLLGEGVDARGYFYDTEYEYMPTLAELYAFGRLSPSSWARIFYSCSAFMDASVEAGRGAVVDGLLRRLVVDKTAERLEAHARATGLDLDAELRLNGAPAPSLAQCLRDVTETLAGCGDVPSVMHGDFCFSNTLFSFRTDRVRLIDPRGLDEQGAFSLYGDARYDLAKLMHSVCGRYDLIVAGQFSGGRRGATEFELSFPEDSGRLQMEEIANGLTMGGVRLGSEVVWAAMTSLFLSMGPLHADRPDRQEAFIANALRLRLAMDRRAAA